MIPCVLMYLIRSDSCCRLLHFLFIYFPPNQVLITLPPLTLSLSLNPSPSLPPFLFSDHVSSSFPATTHSFYGLLSFLPFSNHPVLHFSAAGFSCSFLSATLLYFFFLPSEHSLQLFHPPYPLFYPCLLFMSSFLLLFIYFSLTLSLSFSLLCIVCEHVCVFVHRRNPAVSHSTRFELFFSFHLLPVDCPPCHLSLRRLSVSLKAHALGNKRTAT